MFTTRVTLVCTDKKLPYKHVTNSISYVMHKLSNQYVLIHPQPTTHAYFVAIQLRRVFFFNSNKNLPDKRLDLAPLLSPVHSETKVLTAFKVILPFNFVNTLCSCEKY